MAGRPSLLLPLALACQSPTPDDGPPAEDTGGRQDIRATHLALDVGARAGAARLEVRPGRGADAVTLDVHGLALDAVRLDGAAVDAPVRDGWLEVPLRSADHPVEIEVDYRFPERSGVDFDGWMPDFGVSFVWPDHCGNLFPCDPELVDGVHFTLDVTGYDPSLTAVFAPDLVGESPAYQPALAIGEYTAVELGTTPAGTRLTAWHLPDGAADTAEGTAHLVDAFAFFERTYGPYAFGDHAGTVQVDWGVGSYGGMEHHPFVHVGTYDFWNAEAQVHEMAHGWYGAGVRLECWEDFVLSEGTVTYVTARAMQEVAGEDLWATYVNLFLGPICEGEQVNAVVLPDTCNEIEFETDPLWSLAPYMKGACFYEDVADLVGVELVDEVIADFYRANVGQPARMRELLDLLHSRVTPEQSTRIDALVTDWLLTYECPADYVTRCKQRAR